MTEALAIGLVLIAALVIRGAVGALLRKLSIGPADPTAQSHGIRDVSNWLRRRRARSAVSSDSSPDTDSATGKGE